MTWVLVALTILLIFDALRMRRRVGDLGSLAAAPAAASATSPTGSTGSTFRLFTAPGVALSPSTISAATAYAREHGIDVLDLVPRDLPSIRAMSLVQLVDPPTYRRDRLRAGCTAGHAMLVTADAAARAQLPGELSAVADPVAFAELAMRMKPFGRADFAVAPAERAGPQPLARRFELLRVQLGPATAFTIGAMPILWLLLGLGLWLRPIPALVALGAWQLQPLLGLAGTKLRPRDLLLVFLFRAPIELWIFAGTLAGRLSRAGRTALAADAVARRPEYDRLLASGTERFFEPRRESCPICNGGDLAVHLRNGDLVQHKPGRFTLERCRGCGHVFQNPRLSIAGLDFYYKDFYDGLGAASLEFVFGVESQPYLERARMVRELAAPRRWLDVGAGHGHFCMAAREELPETRFDGLDLSESIEEAQRRGWVETGHRGLFPEVAPAIAGQYDAVSMSHYLEHTLDPRAEIAAAHTALAPRGSLMIEVPDPEFFLGKILRRYWLPWLQPQHLHFLSAGNLEKLLRERGFTPIAWHRGRAHQRVDFFLAVYLFLQHIAPPPRLPWRWRGAGATTWRLFAWTVGLPLVLSAVVIDNLLGPLFSRARVSNTYRVVATKEGPPP